MPFGVFMEYQYEFTSHLVATLFKVTDNTQMYPSIMVLFQDQVSLSQCTSKWGCWDFLLQFKLCQCHLCLFQVQLTRIRIVPPQNINPLKKPKSASVIEESCSSRLEYKNKMQVTNYTASSSFVPKTRNCFLTFCSTEEKNQNKTHKY